MGNEKKEGKIANHLFFRDKNRGKNSKEVM